MGNAWTADYLKITGELDVDLRSNIAAEAMKAFIWVISRRGSLPMLSKAAIGSSGIEGPAWFQHHP
jgi:hypothetical protein